jgi:hypothetical protein
LQEAASSRTKNARHFAIGAKAGIVLPAEETVTAARESKCDSIMLSTCGLTGLDRYLLGVAHRVAQLAPARLFSCVRANIFKNPCLVIERVNRGGNPHEAANYGQPDENYFRFGQDPKCVTPSVRQQDGFPPAQKMKNIQQALLPRTIAAERRPGPLGR